MPRIASKFLNARANHPPDLLCHLARSIGIISVHHFARGWRIEPAPDFRVAPAIDGAPGKARGTAGGGTRAGAHEFARKAALRPPQRLIGAVSESC